ncbi:MAG: hypothetical protein KIH63_004015 [Candidatus Saccharibacteria bacterium]|nr:hypothetical protein [Candidatus Saccharibacteria bacterium]
MTVSKRVKGALKLCVVFGVLLLTLPAHAQTPDDLGSLNLTTSPLPINLTAKPGETVSTELRIKNGGAKTERLKVGLMKFSAYGEEGKPQLKDREPGDDYFDWVRFSETEFTADPDKWHTIQMTVDLPPEAALGYYYAVTFSRADPPGTEQVSAQIAGASAILVLVDVDSPNAKRQLELESFGVAKRSYEFLPVRFVIKIKNSGNIHAVPSGSIFVNKGGKTVATLALNESRGNILPDSSRQFETLWSSGFPVYAEKLRDGAVVYKNDQPQYELTWPTDQLRNLRFGRYTAVLTAVYDDGEKDVPLEAEVSFWVIPWRLLAIVVGLPLLTIGVIVYLVISRRQYRKKAVYRHEA